MIYDQTLDRRIRRTVTDWGNTNYRKMFGRVCHLPNDNMFCGDHNNSLFLRLGKESARIALEAPHVKPFDITGKQLAGWIMVNPKGRENDAELADWREQLRGFADSLPPK